MTVENLVWMLTALAAVVFMLTRSRLTATAKQAGVSETPPEPLGAHTAVGVGALATWVAWLSGAARPVGLVGLVQRWPGRPAVTSVVESGPSGAAADSEATMANHVYSISEIVGSSPEGVEAAVTNAVAQAARTVRNLDWFEVQNIRGQIMDGAVAHWQVTVKIGFRIES